MKIDLIAILVLFIGANCTAQQRTSLKKEFYAMGTSYEVTVVALSFEKAEKAISQAEKEVRRIEDLISSWDEKSQTSHINRMAGISPVEVDYELFDLINRSIKIAELTQGAFDISYASMDKIWIFDGRDYPLPDSLIVRNSVKLIGYDKIILSKDDSSVFLKEEGMKIGFGGIGKGYAAMKVTELMQEAGILGGIVNAGGDLYAWGESNEENGWKVAIADPKEKGTMLAYLQLDNKSIVTSGDYERYVTIDDKRYAHIIDPRTGWPTSGLKSVSVICDDAELADGLATSIFVLGKENGLHLVNQLKGIDCILIDDDDEMFTSEGLNLIFHKAQIGIKDEKN